MSPPIRDGSGDSIGAIRLGDGSEIAEVRTGAGDVLFSADTIVDNFEGVNGSPAGPYGSGDGISDYYSGDVSGYDRNTADPADGSFGLRFTDPEAAIWSHPGDGLPNYPNEGDTVSFLAQDSSGGDRPAAAFHVEDVASSPSAYICVMSVAQDSDIHISRMSDLTDRSSETQLASTSISESADTYFWNEVSLKTSGDNTITYEMYELNADLTRGSQIASVSANDSNVSFSNRGIGWQNDNSGISGTVSFFDRMRIE